MGWGPRIRVKGIVEKTIDLVETVSTVSAVNVGFKWSYVMRDALLMQIIELPPRRVLGDAALCSGDRTKPFGGLPRRESW